MKAATVGKFSVASHPLECMCELTLERNFTNATNVGKPSVFPLPLGDMCELTLEKSPTSARSVEEPSVRALHLYTRELILRKNPWKCLECGITFSIVSDVSQALFFSLL